MPKDKSVPAYKNPSLPVKTRAADLVSRMTLEEKVSVLCIVSTAIPRLGVPAFRWGGECLHGLVHTGKATCFPQTIGLAATFDPDLIERISSAIADEARAKFHNKLWHDARGPRVSLNYFTPNINIFRDPRWGRGQETYGEDPYLTGLMASAFVRGLQGKHPKYLKVAACAKHFAAHSGPENLRSRFDARVSLKDLHETYLPAFKMLVDAGVESVMATYNRVNGEPCPGSKTLLSDILRGQWNFQGHVVSDGGATGAIHQSHQYTKTPLETAVLCLNAGCDLDNSGDPVYAHLPEALAQGLVTQAQIDDAAARVLGTQFKLGVYDDPKRNPYTKIKAGVVQSKEHVALAREAALKSMVLLKNSGALPLGPDVKTVAVSGPNAADVQVLLGNFYRGASANLYTIFEGLVARAPEGTAITHLPGCFLEHPNAHDSEWHIGLAEWADVVVAVVGISPLMEGEQGETIASRCGGDRDQLPLPANQVKYLARLRSKTKGKPLVLIVTGGSPVALGEVEDMADAILFVWYPGEQGGLAAGDLVFGHESPSGRLPITFPKAESDLPPFDDYAMANRTYRYMQAEPLYPFGFGLSYTKFQYGPIKLSSKKIKAGQKLTATLPITNKGRLAGDEVVQLYLTDEQASVATPLYALKGLRRVSLRPRKSATVKFEITPEMLELVGADGRAAIEPGAFTVTIAPSAPHSRAVALGAAKPAVARFEVV